MSVSSACIPISIEVETYDVRLGQDQRNSTDESNRSKVDDAQEGSLRQVSEEEHG